MKNSGVHVFLLLAISLVLGAGGSFASASNDDEDFTVRPGLGFGSVKLGMNRKQITDSLGKRDGVYSLPNGLSVEYSQWKEPDKISAVRVYFDKTGKSVQLSCEESRPRKKSEPKINLATADGITLGTSLKTVRGRFKQLAPVATKSTETDYYDDAKQGIAFEFMKAKVNEGVYAIIVHKPGMPVIIDTDKRPVTRTDVSKQTIPASTNKESAKVYSPDRKHFAFVRNTGKKIETGSGEASAEIIMFGNAEDDSAKALFEGGAELDTKQPIGKIQIADIKDLDFSDDGKQLFFLTSCYATSGAVVAVDTTSGKLRYVTDANSLKYIRSGTHKGYLLVTQHKYKSEKEGGGSYEKPTYVKP